MYTFSVVSTASRIANVRFCSSRSRQRNADNSPRRTPDRIARPAAVRRATGRPAGSSTRRRVVHVGVTPHPTAAWTAQQFREAFPWDEAPRYLIHDRRLAFQALAATAQAMGIEDVRTASRTRWQSAYVEWCIGPGAAPMPRSRRRVDRLGPPKVTRCSSAVPPEEFHGPASTYTAEPAIEIAGAIWRTRLVSRA